MKTPFLLALLTLTTIACSGGKSSSGLTDTKELCANGCFISETRTIRYEYTQIVTEDSESHIASSGFSSLLLKCAPINGFVGFTITPRPAGFVTTFIENNEIHFDYLLAFNSQVHLIYECNP